MYLVDTHCHIDHYNDPLAVVNSAEANRVYTIAVTSLPSAFDKVKSLLQGRELLFPALGLHPQNAYRYHFQMARMWALFDQTRYISEIGLDYKTANSSDRQVQRYVFNKILERCSVAGNKILSVHSRRAVEDVISAIGPDFPGKVILHWFTGTRRQLALAVSNGYYFSVNPAMVGSKNWTSLAPLIPRDRLLTESDGPFTKVKGMRVWPCDMVQVISSMASLARENCEEMARVIHENFVALHAVANAEENS